MGVDGTNMTLDEFLTNTIDTVRRVGAPLQPTLFTWAPTGANVAVLAGENPVVLAHAAVAQFKPVYVVLAGASLHGSPLVFFHAEGDGLTIDQVRDTAHDWVIVPGTVMVNPFGGLLNARR